MAQKCEVFNNKIDVWNDIDMDKLFFNVWGVEWVMTRIFLLLKKKVQFLLFAIEILNKELIKVIFLAFFKLNYSTHHNSKAKQCVSYR